LMATAIGSTSATASTGADRSGRELFEASCASCHGTDGRGGAAVAAAYPLTPPDLTDCNFATREPDSDWIAVAHEGGPARGFNRVMPAFGELLNVDELQRVITYVRRFCPDPAWPRGELNLPRAQVTSKAYPEDEAALRVIVGETEVTTRLVYARRFGARTQLEVVAPLVFAEETPGDWTGGVGDLAVSAKRVLIHNLGIGSILSAAVEVVTPTGNSRRGLGGGALVFEGYLAYGQILPARSFVQLQLGGGVPYDRDHADELFARTAFGRRFVQGFGRIWTPMFEVVGARELTADAVTHVDVVPQLQVTLNARQNIVGNVGVRLPVNDRDSRGIQVMVYLIWDWFDGGILEGW
jgi:mono/diheme cytochrome c family protein